MSILLCCIIVLFALLIVVLFLLATLPCWLMKVFGHGSIFRDSYNRLHIAAFREILSGSVNIYRFESQQTAAPKLLFLLGLNADYYLQTQYILMKALVRAGFDVYVLRYGSIMGKKYATEEVWRSEILCAYRYVGARYIFARSLACSLVSTALYKDELSPLPLRLCYVTPVPCLDRMMSAILTGIGDDEPSLGIPLDLFYYESDFLRGPSYDQPANVYLLPEPPGCGTWSIHMQGPPYHADFIAQRFASNIAKNDRCTVAT